MNTQAKEEKLLRLRRQYLGAITTLEIIKTKIALAELEYLSAADSPKALGYFLEITDNAVTIKHKEDSIENTMETERACGAV